MSRDIVSHYYPRESMRALARQYFQIRAGAGADAPQAWQARLVAARRSRSWASSARPSLLVVAPWNIGGLSLAAYALATGAEAVRVGRAEGVAAIPVVWAIFPVLHASHGAGFATAS